MGHTPESGLHTLYRELGVIEATSFTEMTTYGLFVDETSGNRIQVSKDLRRLAADISALSPADASLLNKLVADAIALQGRDLTSVGMGKPPELVTPLDRLSELWQMRSLLKYLVGGFSRPVGDYASRIRSPWLRGFLTSLFLPEVPVWFILMILASVADGQVAYLAGGCLEFVTAIENRYRRLGGVRSGGWNDCAARRRGRQPAPEQQLPCYRECKC